MKTLILLALGLMPLGLPAAAQSEGTLSYDCNLDGVSGRLIAQYEVVGNSGITYSPNGDISSVIGTGSSTVYYQGQLTSPTARYAFTGENQFADFTDMSTYERFRVQFVAEGSQLLMIANPFGAAPTRYMCTLNGN